MKKNITINLFGTLYAIDEDAYTLLERYLDSMKTYFSRQEGGAEIADDIEHRVAELLWEQKQNGVDAVNIDMVKAIIEQIGNPEEIADESRSNDSGSSEDAQGRSDFRSRMTDFAFETGEKADNIYNKVKASIRDKRLYRNPRDKVIGGVCSGLAEYFGTNDPLWWRLGFALLALLFFFEDSWFIPDVSTFVMPGIYVALLLIVPVAQTPEDTLRMKGQEVSPETLKEQVISETEAERTPSPTVSKTANGCLKALLVVFLIMLLFPMFAGLILLIIGIVAFICVAFDAQNIVASALGFPTLLQIIDAGGIYILIGALAGFIALAILIYAVFRIIRTSKKPMSSGKLTFLTVLWILSATLFFMSIIFANIRAEELQRICM